MSEPLRVLMVEDQQDLRELIGQALQDFGIEIHTADDGPAALRLMQDPGGFDVVFSDISMPNGMSGVELSEHVADVLPNARIILASGYARSQLPPLPEHVEFLPKPYRLRQLVTLLQSPVAPC
ncbi:MULTISPECIES: response regulator [Gammaproteobacteria]|jgi:two-component system cell cycle response regulator CpdR|uniref:Response regulator n=1 Tax=Stenotrophomonas rhizophila TaxID=216778 RepID=A0A498CH25_9GAMM|nr:MULTISPECIES: response regulator [Stenotrophomonas]MBU2049585.1 response regulator [Gammaproteobacteria bacterium]KAB7632241.1 response regulator [Stenotrophomonas rhizophila]NYF34802.1 CheY-like chemotaxis protein [Stenotrophomonas sp. JAI102]RLK56313.1 response regulator receiver domain-containing protein [Stenotrophomonas rhizophila]HAU80592.1 two-component system response regulator [Stenotrophomonas sp.]